MTTLIRQHICVLHIVACEQVRLSQQWYHLQEQVGMKRKDETPESIFSRRTTSTVLLIKPLILLPLIYPRAVNKNNLLFRMNFNRYWKPAEHLSVQAWSVKSIMFWMWMMAGMIALEFNSLTRTHNECTRFLSHNPEFQFFHSKSYYVTYNKSCLS